MHIKYKLGDRKVGHGRCIDILHVGWTLEAFKEEGQNLGSLEWQQEMTLIRSLLGGDEEAFRAPDGMQKEG